MNRKTMLLRIAAISLLAPLAGTAEPEPEPVEPRAPREAGRQIVLGPDDKPAFEDPPADFNTPRDVPHGKLEMVDYESTTVDTTRKVQVYTLFPATRRTRNIPCSICCMALVATKPSGSALPRWTR